MTDWTRVPVLVGAGQYTNRETDPSAAPDPFELMTLAAREAAASAVGAGRVDELIGALSHCYMVHSLSLRHGDPAGALAQRLGADRAEARCSGMGGNIPQWLLDRAAEQVLAGDRPVVLVVGAEALATRRRAKRQEITLEWPKEPGWPDTWPPMEPDVGVHPVERAGGLEQATAMYALIETVLRHSAGSDPGAHQKAIGQLMARFNEVAAANPNSWFPERRSADEIVTVTDDNRIIFHPYPKFVNAVMNVDMAAAVVLTDAQTARGWGLAPDELVYLRGWADAKEVWYVSERRRLQRADSLAACASEALQTAGIGLGDLGAFDLYSCFPSSIEAALQALSLEPDDPRPLTLTGGLPYHGGPGSNYVTHAVANVVDWLRAGHGDHALVHGNGYYLTKHAVGVYSRSAPDDPPAPGAGLQERLDAEADRLPVEPSLSGRAAVVAYTVPYDRQGAPQNGAVIVEAGGRRTVASADQPLTETLVAEDAIGLTVVLDERSDAPALARPA